MKNSTNKKTDFPKKDYSDLWRFLPKGTFVSRAKLEKIIGFKEELDPQRFQFEILKIQKAIEIHSRLNGRALFTRQDAGAIKVMHDEEASAYKTQQQYKLLERVGKLQKDKDLIDVSNLSNEELKLHQEGISRFDRYLAAIKTTAEGINDRKLRIA